MTTLVTPPPAGPALPDHTQLPDRDGTFVINFQEPAQTRLLTDTLEPVLAKLHPDGQYAIGRDCGIYWRWTDPPLDGCKAPDWFYVPGVPPTLEGQVRRSYVLWQELIAPLLIAEVVSGDGSEERDQTPWQGKFWIYEQALRTPYYAIYEVDPGRVEVHHLVDNRYLRMPANERGHYPIAPLGVELGIWQGRFENMEFPWLRWWDPHGQLLPTAAERAEQALRQADQERREKELAQRQAAEERRETERLAARLRALGIDPKEP